MPPPFALVVVLELVALVDFQARLLELFRYLFEVFLLCCSNFRQIVLHGIAQYVCRSHAWVVDLVAENHIFVTHKVPDFIAFRHSIMVSVELSEFVMLIPRRSIFTFVVYISFGAGLQCVFCSPSTNIKSAT